VFLPPPSRGRSALIIHANAAGVNKGSLPDQPTRRLTGVSRRPYKKARGGGQALAHAIDVHVHFGAPGRAGQPVHGCHGSKDFAGSIAYWKCGGRADAEPGCRPKR